MRKTVNKFTIIKIQLRNISLQFIQWGILRKLFWKKKNYNRNDDNDVYENCHDYDN